MPFLPLDKTFYYTADSNITATGVIFEGMNNGSVIHVNSNILGLKMVF